MRESEQQKEVPLEIRLPKGGYAKTMFFNCLCVEHEDGFCVVHFGLFSNKGGSLLDSYSCIVPRLALEHNQKPLLEYLARIGSPKDKLAMGWRGPAGQVTHVADIISMAFSGDMAETCLCVFSLTAVARQRGAPSAGLLEAQPLALLRSSLERQKQLITALYEE